MGKAPRARVEFRSPNEAPVETTDADLPELATETPVALVENPPRAHMSPPDQPFFKIVLKQSLKGLADEVEKQVLLGYRPVGSPFVYRQSSMDEFWAQSVYRG